MDHKTDICYATILPEMFVCDVIPHHPHTLFLQEAEKAGAHTIDGLGMLINQAVISFKLWTGCDSNPEVMKKALAKEYGIE